jgi:hypothetical protein
MTRYEFFEAWLTPKEWAEWKKHSVKRFRHMYGLNLQEARARRKNYLNSQLYFDVTDRPRVLDEWDDMTNRHIHWRDTTQGHNHWSQVNSRTAPCRVLPTPRTIVIINNPN